MSAEPTLVELLYLDGCPGIHRVLPVVTPLAEAAGARVVQRRVETPQEAEAQRFLGSPTVPHRGARGSLDARRLAAPDIEPAQRQAMSELQTTAITDVLGEDRWAANRIAGLNPTARRLYALILYRFTEGGPPKRDELSDLGFDAATLWELVDRDLVQLGADAEVAVAYPFSALPTRHRVFTEDGRAYWAMCAIDALGMPYLLHQAAEIRAQGPDSDRAITVAIDPETQAVRADPADAAVVVARVGDGCAARCACPHIILFGSTTAAERYLVASELGGTILDIAGATAAGRRAFGDLVDRLSAGGRR